MFYYWPKTVGVRILIAGFFMIVYDLNARTSYTIDGREIAPGEMTESVLQNMTKYNGTRVFSGMLLAV